MVTQWLPTQKNIITIEKQNIILCDCLTILKELPEKTIDLIVTSPPYNIGIKYGDYQDKKSFDKYLAWLHEIFSQIRRVLRDEGSVFLNIGSTNRNPWLAFDAANYLRHLFVLQNRIVWVKSISIGNITYGHFKPINSDRYVNHLYEEIL
jgi:site-specific DNA-methyltransferase (adenine-specific)